MDKQLLTDDIIIEHLDKKYGLPEEPDALMILELIQNEYGGNLDTDSSWAQGHEDRIIYYQSTADSYEVYVSTQSHDHKDVYFEQDVYYYVDAQQFSEDILESLESGYDVWVDSCIYPDIEWEFHCELEQWYADFYVEKEDEAREELLDTGDYYEEKEEE